MVAALMVFVLVTGSILGAYAVLRRVPALMAERRLEQRLHDVGPAAPEAESTVLTQRVSGPMPAIDRLVASSRGGAWLTRLVEQSGVQTTPSAIVHTTADRPLPWRVMPSFSESSNLRDRYLG